MIENDEFIDRVVPRTREGVELVRFNGKVYKVDRDMRPDNKPTVYLRCHSCNYGRLVYDTAEHIVYADPNKGCALGCVVDEKRYVHQHYHFELLELNAREAVGGRSVETLHGIVVEEMRQRFGDDMANSFPNAQRKKTPSYRERALFRPPIPHAFDQIPLYDAIPERFAQTFHGLHQFLYANQDIIVNNVNLGRMMLFSTAHDLRQLAASRRVFLDGTFKVTPAPFAQMVTLHTTLRLDGDHQTLLPRVYVLLPSKSADVYRAMFAVLVELLEAHMPPGEYVRWRYMMLDFETGLIAALSTQDIDPYDVLRKEGCVYHYCSAVYRYLSANCQLAGEYTHNAQFRLMVKLLFAVPFVREEEMLATFIAVVHFYRPPHLQHDARVTQFVNYIATYWMQNPQRRHMLNCFHRTDRRTNNDVEGFHRALLLFFRTVHPNLWAFIERLSEFHTIYMHREIAIKAQGMGIRCRAKLVRDREAVMATKRTMYVNGATNALEYILGLVQHMPGFPQ